VLIIAEIGYLVQFELRARQTAVLHVAFLVLVVHLPSTRPHPRPFAHDLLDPRLPSHGIIQSHFRLVPAYHAERAIRHARAGHAGANVARRPLVAGPAHLLDLRAAEEEDLDDSRGGERDGYAEGAGELRGRGGGGYELRCEGLGKVLEKKRGEARRRAGGVCCARPRRRDAHQAHLLVEIK
jgi:hypothetical protein